MLEEDVNIFISVIGLILLFIRCFKFSIHCLIEFRQMLQIFFDKSNNNLFIAYQRRSKCFLTSIYKKLTIVDIIVYSIDLVIPILSVQFRVTLMTWKVDQLIPQQILHTTVAFL